MITVIGSINLDLVTAVERLPSPGETVSGKGFAMAAGGKGANQALAAARAGATVRMIGAVGRDDFASQALALLREAKLDLSGVAETDETTGTALIMVDGKGENIIAVAPGANGMLKPASVPALAGGEIVLLQLESPLDTVEAALDAAAKAGASSILNTAPALAEAADLVAKASVVVANEIEFDLYAKAMGLRGETREARMAAFAEKTGRVIVVTLGAEGAIAQTGTETIRVPSIKVAPVDTVGAGDTFCGYLAAGLAAGDTLEQAMRRAAVAGALACTKAGAQPAIPLAADVSAALPKG